MKVELEVVKISAIGCYKRFMRIKLPNNKQQSFIINKELYKLLKDLGVPTCQKLATKKTNS